MATYEIEHNGRKVQFEYDGIPDENVVKGIKDSLGQETTIEKGLRMANDIGSPAIGASIGTGIGTMVGGPVGAPIGGILGAGIGNVIGKQSNDFGNYSRMPSDFIEGATGQVLGAGLGAIGGKIVDNVAPMLKRVLSNTTGNSVDDIATAYQSGTNKIESKLFSDAIEGRITPTKTSKDIIKELEKDVNVDRTMRSSVGSNSAYMNDADFNRAKQILTDIANTTDKTKIASLTQEAADIAKRTRQLTNATPRPSLNGANTVSTGSLAGEAMSDITPHGSSSIMDNILNTGGLGGLGSHILGYGNSKATIPLAVAAITKMASRSPKVVGRGAQIAGKLSNTPDVVRKLIQQGILHYPDIVKE